MTSFCFKCWPDLFDSSSTMWSWRFFFEFVSFTFSFTNVKCVILHMLFAHANVCFCGHDGPNHHFRVGQALRANRLTHRVGEPFENSCVLRVTHLQFGASSVSCCNLVDKPYQTHNCNMIHMMSSPSLISFGIKLV